MASQVLMEVRRSLSTGGLLPMPTLIVTQSPDNALFTAKSIQWLESGDLRLDLWLDGSPSAEFLDLHFQNRVHMLAWNHTGWSQ